ncbi:MAG: peptidyl-tRNA hydrolase PTH1 family [Bacillota bacterium]|nr:MAG: peptidyl-tRNA hydrolase PTH1 family [Bacillota bacterium]MBS3950610.1 aminoacyl-tRNA hydrolase [Peptococcaceae bacterium]
MKLIVGLGNPGPQYVGTRHNAGFEVVVHLAQRHGIRVSMATHQSLLGRGTIAGQGVYLQQPLTYMNLSGAAVKSAVKAFEISTEDLLVISDDLDLPLGTIRLRANGGSGGQKGLKSIAGCLGTENFARLRIGIGRPLEGMAVEDYVLTKWSQSERDILKDVVASAAEAAECFVSAGVVEAANRYNKHCE